MSGKSKSRSTARWTPSEEKVGKLISSLTLLEDNAPRNVHAASMRVREAFATRIEPDAEDATLLLLWVLDRAERARNKPRFAPAKPRTKKSLKSRFGGSETKEGSVQISGD